MPSAASHVVVLLLVAVLAAAGFVLVAFSLQPVSLPWLVGDPASVGQQCLACVSDSFAIVGPWFEVPAVVCVCVSDCPVVLDPWFEVPAVGFAAAVAADEFAALALHFLL